MCSACHQVQDYYYICKRCLNGACKECMKAWIRKESRCMTCKGYLNLNFVIDTRKVIALFPYRELAKIREL